MGLLNGLAERQLQCKDLTCPLYLLLDSLIGVVDITIVDYMDRLHSFKHYYAHKLYYLDSVWRGRPIHNGCCLNHIIIMFRYETPSINKMCH